MSPADSPFASLPAAPGPHPALAELRAYAADALAPAEQHRIEAHALDCERCADVLAGLAMSDDATTDQAVATLRARLQARVQAAPPVAAPAKWWPRVAAAAALLGVMAGGVWTWEQRSAPGAPAASLPETARLKTAPPEAPSAPPPGPTAAPLARAAPPADYAAAPPRLPSPRDRLSRAARPITGSPAASDQPASLENADLASAAVAEAPAPPPTAAAGVAAAPAADKQVVAELAKKEAVADSTVGAKPGGLAGGLAKARARAAPAKSMAASNAAAYVPATPMPAGPALAPAPVGGTLALRAYLSREAAGFLPEPNAQRLTGTVRVRLVVSADGKITQLKVARGLRPDYDAEALRIVCEGPAWQPGVAGGQRAALPIELAVPF